MQTDDRSLAQMSEWIAQYKSQRSAFVAERKKQYDEVVADVHKLLDAGMDTFAIDKATEAYTVADNKENFSNEAWVESLVKRASALGEGYEASDEWIRARRNLVRSGRRRSV